MKYLIRPAALQAYSPANHLLEGSAHVEVGGERFEMQAGDACFFPPDQPHVFQATSRRARVLVIYAPPYLEKPENVRT